MSVHYQRSRELAHVSELPKVVPAVLPKSLGASSHLRRDQKAKKGDEEKLFSLIQQDLKEKITTRIKKMRRKRLLSESS